MEGRMVVVHKNVKVCRVKGMRLISVPTQSSRRLGESTSDTLWLRVRDNCQSKVSFLGKLQVY